MSNIDDTTIKLMRAELQRIETEELNKGMPPKLKYKFLKWLRSLNPDTTDKQQDRRHTVETVKNELISKVTEAIEHRNLQKNEVMMSAFSDGTIKFDFGSEIPDTIKKAAIQWAKKRGIPPYETGLNKSDNLVFSKNSPKINSNCVKRVKWIVD